METYCHIGLLRSYGNLQSYWNTAKLWKLTVVLDYYEAMETYSRVPVSGPLLVNEPDDAFQKNEAPTLFDLCLRKIQKTTLEASGEDWKTTLEASGEDRKTTLEASGEDVDRIVPRYVWDVLISFVNSLTNLNVICHRKVQFFMFDLAVFR
jgi:hypothetical protein